MPTYMENYKCKTCKHFERGKWHKAVDPDESDQLGGHCKVLDGVLKLTNSFMIYDRVYIQESFGCVFHSELTTE